MNGEMKTSFKNLFQVPAFLEPHLNLMFTPQEVELVVAVGEEGTSVKSFAEKQKLTLSDAQMILEEGYKGYLLEKEEETGETRYYPGEFYHRLDYQCKFDPHYRDLPPSLKKQLDEWCMEEYLKRIGEDIVKLKEGKPTDNLADTFMLLQEAEEFIDVAREIRVIPCNCRRLKEDCNKPVEVCLTFDDAITDRTAGRSISREEAKELVRDAGKKGLMHTGNFNWREKGPSHMCNCCSCCCYPCRIGEREDIRGIWPLARYKASFAEDLCNSCRRCIKRCHYQAFSLTAANEDGDGEGAKIIYDAEQCVGCGLCSLTCKAGAITMVPLK